MSIKSIIKQGVASDLELALSENPELANTPIRWGKSLSNTTDPLHYLSDCVFNNTLTCGNATELAKILLRHGALINGSDNAETPLIGAVSLSAEPVAKLLLNEGADIHATSVHGSTALHWASYVGMPKIANELINLGADIECKCTSFQSTPLFWGTHSIRYNDQSNDADIIATIKVLIEHGANLQTENFQNYSVQQLAQDTGNKELINTIRTP